MIFWLHFERRVLHNVFAFLNLALFLSIFLTIFDYYLFDAFDDLVCSVDAFFEGAAVGLHFEFEFYETIFLVDLSFDDVGEYGALAELAQQAEAQQRCPEDTFCHR
jgi:hypothetical protein